MEFFHEGAFLRATETGKQSYVSVKPVWAAPHSQGMGYLSLLNSKGEEVAFLENPDTTLSSVSLEALRSELRWRDLTARVASINAARQEYGATYWNVQTDRGTRDFVTQSHSENAIWYGTNRLLVLDVDGNRFEFEDVEALDARSKTLLEGIL